MSDENFLREVDAEVDLLGTYVIFQLAADRQETWVVAPDDLILDEPLLKGMCFFEGFCLFFQHFQEILIDLLRNGVGLHLLRLNLSYNKLDYRIKLLIIHRWLLVMRQLGWNLFACLRDFKELRWMKHFLIYCFILRSAGISLGLEFIRYAFFLGLSSLLRLLALSVCL